MHSKSSSTQTVALALLVSATLAGCHTTTVSSASNVEATATTTAAAVASESATVQRLGAVGIGVSDLAASTEFYRYILGLEVLRTYELGYINENVLGYSHGEGAVLVLMNWPDEPDRRYAGDDVKVVFYVDDPKGVIERIRERGGNIDREAIPHPAVNNTLVGLGRDPDNYVVEVLER